MTAAPADWLLDLGNSRLKFAPLSRDGAIGPVTARDHAAPGWTEGLPAGGTAWVSSVASPTLTLQLVEGLAARFGRVHMARTSASCAGVAVGYAQPHRLGVDRFLALLGAFAAGGGPWLVVGVGTALTIDLLDADGRHAGGRIAPSPTLMREALHARATHLPTEGGTYHEFATDTPDALASGCDGAAIALVERSLARARAMLGREVQPLLHGGGAEALAARVDGARVEPALVLRGLAAWARIGMCRD